METLPGQRLGKYTLIEELGRGAMGAVFKGYDATLERPVAVKVLAPQLTWEAQFVERFLREARTAARLRHPNIVAIFDVGQEDGWYYFVMEYLPGETLREHIRRRGALPPAEVLQVAGQLASALDYAHGQGVVHRDVKPGNVMISPEGHVTLTDFGIVKAASETHLTATGVTLGTPEYMAPEQAAEGQVSPATDLYALGVVVYEMLSGQVPFQADSTMALLYRIVHEPPPPLRQRRPGLPPGVDTVLQRALAKNPQARYPSGAAFVQALELALAGREVPSEEAPTVLLEAPGRPPSPPRTPRRSPWPLPAWAWGTVGVLLVGLFTLTAISLSTKLGPPPPPPTTAIARVASMSPTPTHTPTSTTTVESTRSPTATPTPTARPTWTPTPTQVVTCPTGRFLAQYYSGGFAGHLALARCEDAPVAYDWGDSGPGSGIGTDHFAVRWAGRFDFAPGCYTFLAGADDGIALWVDGQLLIDEWRDQPYNEHEAVLCLEAGLHEVKVEYYENEGGARVRAEWRRTPTPTPTPTATPTATPTPLTSCPDGQFLAEYYPSRFHSPPTFTRCENAPIDYNWGGGGPGGGIGSDDFAVRWIGRFDFAAGCYTFLAGADDGIILWVDGQVLIDEWHDQNYTPYEAGRCLSAGLHEVKVEYYENKGGARVRVEWRRTGTPTPTATPTPTPTATPTPTPTPRTSCPDGQFLAQYYASRFQTPPTFTRCEDAPIEYNWDFGGPGGGIGSDDFAVRWTGRFDFAEGCYNFLAGADDGIRLWVDGQLLIDAWWDQMYNEYEERRCLEAGLHEVKVEYYENKGGARVRVEWWRTVPPAPTVTAQTPAPGWITRAQMPTARDSAAVVAFGGRIYVIGGTGSSGPLAVVEVYDPATDTWSSRRAMPTAKALASAAVIGTRIYVLGSDTLVYAYDPAADEWDTVASIPQAADAEHGVGVVNGKLYVGMGNQWLYMYDPVADTWVARTPCPVERSISSFAVLNGRLYAIGGGEPGHQPSEITRVDVYNPATDSWHIGAISDMPTRRTHMDRATPVVNGRIYVIGGWDGYSALSTVDIYDPATNSWSTGEPMPTARYAMGSAVIGNTIYVIGGNWGGAGGHWLSTNEALTTQ